MRIKGQALTTLKSTGWEFDMDSKVGWNKLFEMERRVEWDSAGNIMFYHITNYGKKIARYVSYFELSLFYEFLAEVLENE